MGITIPSYAEELVVLAARALFPEGGQRTARRNAWQAMVADAARSRARAEAEVAVSLAPYARAHAAHLPQEA